MKSHLRYSRPRTSAFWRKEAHVETQYSRHFLQTCFLDGASNRTDCWALVAGGPCWCGGRGPRHAHRNKLHPTPSADRDFVSGSLKAVLHFSR
ncbi:unnamed protein product, partial [Iphiclides podalirius]